MHSYTYWMPKPYSRVVIIRICGPNRVSVPLPSHSYTQIPPFPLPQAAQGVAQPSHSRREGCLWRSSHADWAMYWSVTPPQASFNLGWTWLCSALLAHLISREQHSLVGFLPVSNPNVFSAGTLGTSAPGLAFRRD